MIQFVLDEPDAHIGSIQERAGSGELTVDAHLFLESSARRVMRRLAGPWMSAAGIRPASTGMVFPVGAALEQQSPLHITQEYREGAMQRSGSMRFQLGRDADGRVLGVDENHQFIGVLHAHRPTSIRYLEILGVSLVELSVSSEHLTSLIGRDRLPQDRLNADEEYLNLYRRSVS